MRGHGRAAFGFKVRDNKYQQISAHGNQKGDMRFKIGLLLSVVMLAALPSWSQDQAATETWQVSVVGTANIQAQASNGGVTDRASKSGGIVFTGRYHWKGNWWFEANGGFTTFTQYYTPVTSTEQANIYEGTGGIVYYFKSQEHRLRPFAEFGGGVEYFSPVLTGSTGGGQKQVEGAGMAGVGADYKLDSVFSLRFGYRGLMYKPPTFGISTQTLNTFAIMHEPYVGFEIRF